MIWFMTTVHVRANQTTVDWAEGAEFVCERTPFVDNLIQHGGLTELGLALSAADVADLGTEYLDALHVAAAQANVNSSSEERQDVEKALADAQADATAAQENLTEARADSADTLAELNTELDNEPPKTTRPRRKSS